MIDPDSLKALRALIHLYLKTLNPSVSGRALRHALREIVSGIPAQRALTRTLAPVFAEHINPDSEDDSFRPTLRGLATEYPLTQPIVQHTLDFFRYKYEREGDFRIFGWEELTKFLSSNLEPDEIEDLPLQAFKQILPVAGLSIGWYGSEWGAPNYEDFLELHTVDDLITWHDERTGRELLAKKSLSHGTRSKDQKFQILDAPTMRAPDFAVPCGILGRILIFLDIDGFKAINTKYSERVVDRSLLPSIQKLVAEAVRDNGYAYAEGGDEMLIHLPNATVEMGLALAEALRTRIQGHPFEIEGAPINLTASIGVAGSPSEPGSTLADLANQAMRAAKAHGRNCVALHGDGQVTIVPSTQ